MQNEEIEKIYTIDGRIGFGYRIMEFSGINLGFSTHFCPNCGIIAIRFIKHELAIILYSKLQ